MTLWSDFPIPVYTADLRERLVLAYRVDARALRTLVPPPLAPERRDGAGWVAVSLINLRSFRPVGFPPLFGGRFHAAMVTTPVGHFPACREARRGHYFLRLLTDCRPLARFARAALGIQADWARLEMDTTSRAYRGAAGGAQPLFDLQLPRPLRPGSLGEVSAFDDPSEAQRLLADAEYAFYPGPTGRTVLAVPIHEYARCYWPVTPIHLNSTLAQQTLGPDVAAELDHVAFLRRATVTWYFPPETIPLCPQAAWQRLPALSG